ncbi:MAG: flagellin, partial [Ruminobacter sp.]|nr:flagellin [Ruminobacter sp.]
MALYVKTNVSSMNAQRMLSNSTTALDNSYKRLASGLR